MDRHTVEPTVTTSAGSDRGFVTRYAVLLLALGALYLLRDDIGRVAAHPREALRETELLIARITDLIPLLLLLIILLAAAAAAGVVLYRRWLASPMTVPRPRPGERRIRMGRIRGSRRTYDVPSEGIWDHWLILGRSRFGKSRHAATLARQYLDAGTCGLIVVDPHDELCRSFVAASNPALSGRPLSWVSFGRGDLVPGLNILERLPGESPAQVAERFVALVDWLYFGGESVDHQKCTNNLRLAAWAVSSVGGLLPDLRVFLTSPRYRGWLAERTQDRFLLQAMTEYNANVAHDQSWPQSALNRLADLLDNEPLRRIVAQPTSFDLAPALDRNGVLLVSLDETLLGEKGVFLLAGLLLHQIAARLKVRPKDDDFHENPKVRLILDEAQSFEVGLLKGMIGELAGRGLALTLMTQGLSQFSDPRLFDYVTNNFGAYSIFAVSDHEAEPLAKQLFSSRGNRIGMVDEQGRPVHFLSVPEQLVESKRLLTEQLRRQFVAKAYGQEATLCESFELRPAVEPDAVEALRRAEARRLGRPADAIERLLQERMRTLRALRPTPLPEPVPPNVPAAGPASDPTTMPPRPDAPAGSPPAAKKKARSRHDGRRADEQDRLL